MKPEKTTEAPPTELMPIYQDLKIKWPKKFRYNSTKVVPQTTRNPSTYKLFENTISEVKKKP